MAKHQKGKSHRIMVSMPQVMFADFKEKSDQSGLSISRIIYLRLKTKGSMILVPQEILHLLRQLVEIYERISAAGKLAESDRLILQRIIDFETKLVAFDEKVSIVHGKKVKKRD